MKKPPVMPGVDCVFIGGCADGTLLRSIRADAQFIELRRPNHIKPLETPSQNFPDIEHDKDVYEVHVIGLTNHALDKSPHLFAVAAVEGKTLTWAFSQLVIGYVENTTNKMLAEGLIVKN